MIGRLSEASHFKLTVYCSYNSSDINANALKDVLKCLHAEQINLQAARQLIQLLHNNPTQEVDQVSG